MSSLQIRSSPTPAAVVVFRDRQICLPTSVFDTNVSIVSKIIAHELTMDRSFFSCSLCSESFVVKGCTSCLTVAEMCVGPCDKMYHRTCIEQYVADNGALPFCDDKH